jgi:hypothetical protein
VGCKGAWMKALDPFFSSFFLFAPLFLSLLGANDIFASLRGHFSHAKRIYKTIVK